jgi:TetR/AcrR family transcriptional repressor of nem operon
MSKHDDKKDHILRAGLELMKVYGYNGTGVKDIVDAAGVPKGSFYNYFESKESFAIDALETVADDDYRIGRQLLSAGGTSPLGQLQYFFEQNALRLSTDEFRIGCFFGNLGQEMSDSNEVIREKVKLVLKRNTQHIRELLDEAKDAGEIKQTAQTDIMAEFIFNAWEGTLLRMKASRSRESLDAFLEMLPKVVS